MSNMPPGQNKQPPQGPDGPSGGGTRPPIPGWVILLVLLALGLIFTVRLSSSVFGPTTGNAIDVPYSFFVDQVKAGMVRTVTMTGSTVTGEFARTVTYTPPGADLPLSGLRFATMLPPVEDRDLLPLLTEKQVTIQVEDSSPSPLLVLLLNWGPLILIGLILIWTFTRARQQQSGIFGFGQSRARQYNEEHPQVTFADVAGEDEAKNELTEMVDFL